MKRLIDMKKTGILIILLLMTLFGTGGYLSAINETAFYNEGNENYSKGQYEKALELYQKVIDAGVNSSDLYYNAGNTCFKLGKTGWARYYWEKALILAPHDQDIRYNIEYLKVNKLKDRFKQEEGGNVFYLIYQSVGLRAWYHSFIILYGISCLALGLKYFCRREGLKFTLMIIFIAGMILCIYSGTNLYLKNYYESKSRNAVIIAEQISVKNEPGDTLGKEIFNLHEGTLVRIVESRSNWHKIIAGDNLVGWIRKDVFKII